MRRIIAIAGICFFVSNCFAQEQYHNSDWRFSFDVPYGWNQITSQDLTWQEAAEVEGIFNKPATLSEFIELMSEKKRPDDTEGILAIFQQDDSGPKYGAHMIVQCKTIGDPHQTITAEAVLEDALRSNGYRNTGFEILRTVEKIAKAKITKETRANRQIHYDKDYRAFYESTAFTNSNNKRVVIARIRILGSNRVTTLVCHSLDNDPEDFLAQMKELVASFAYDENYGYGQAPATVQIKTIISWLLPTLGTFVLMFLAYGWVKR